MRKVLLGLVLLTSFVTALSFSSQADARVVGFQPGRIIDDVVFTNHTTMSVADIQRFLESKVPTCDTWGTQMYNSWQTRAQFAATIGRYPPFTCLKDYSEKGLSAAQIIYNAAQSYRINPQVLIVLLQKEQGLVTDSWPYTTQYRTATGYGCPDTAACDSTYYGFTNQINWASRMYRAIMDASPYWYTPYVVGNNYIQYNPNTSCGGSIVYIQNRATQALYNYTPYQPNSATLDADWGTAPCGAYGNRNFYLYFTSWFGITTGTSLVQSPSSSTVYFLSNNKRFGVPSGDILYAYGLERTPITPVSDDYLKSIPEGGMLTTIFTLPGDGTVFLADGSKRYGIASGTYCVNWNLPCGDPNYQHELGPELKGWMPDNGPLQPIMNFQGQFSLMSDGNKLPFTSEIAMTQRGYSTANSTKVINWTNAIRKYGNLLIEDNSFVKFKTDDTIYLYSNNNFFNFTNFTAFNAWAGSNPKSYYDTQSAYNSVPPTVTATLSDAAVGPRGLELIDYSKKYSLPPADELASTPIDLAIHPYLDPLVSNKPTITLTADNAVGVPNGTIFSFTGNALNPIPTMVDLRLQYKDADVVLMPPTVLNLYPIGKLGIPAGRIVAPTDNGSMYIYGADKNLWALGNLNELAAVSKWTPNAIKTKFENIDMAGIKIYSRLVSLDKVSYIVDMNGTLRPFDQSVLTNTDNVMPADGPLSPNMPISTTKVTFIGFDNGTIFHVSDSAIRPLASFDAYRRLGGSPTNTVSLPLKSLSSFSIGPVIY